ncbi:MAG: undecaprenyl/decaprenyl-phosphate alpha-N-acetylglucosaminyl 1-phosphate transferase [Anaerolineae bacterium]|nr:undecaprenyl/decaprenyl-phosphate alpha-N-acetylglucosaminyl 1-phosphate transferase [Anaerolineae bacterium]MDW8070890.1 MraY family glycosyltransferase [Anaerolineae bacterium]
MTFTTMLIIFTAALLVAAAVTPLARRAGMRWGFVDHPSARKIHTSPMPRFGGIAMVSAVLIALLVFEGRYGIEQLASILIGASWVSILGALDDRWGLRPVYKLLGQVGAAAFLIPFGVQVSFLPAEWLNWAITIVWIVGITNAINFLDNMDGLAGGIVAIAAGYFLLLAVQSGQYLVGGLAAALLGASVGFLFYNLNPASIFMGDTGSLFLGFILAALGIKLRFPGNSPTVTWMVPVLVLALPIFDTTLVVVSRLRRGIHPATPGRDHISHRLVRKGFTQRETVLLLYLVSGMSGMVAQFVTHANVFEAYMLCGAVAVLALYAMWWLERIPLESTRDPQKDVTPGAQLPSG